MAMSKIKALQMWCKRALEGYRDVNIVDMTKSWRSGLAFCAMIHKFRPDLIDYDSLDKENVYENNKLAFDVAEQELSIPALLEAADMVAMKVPDRLSVITYVAQYHNYFKDKPMLGGPGISEGGKATGAGVKRHHEGSEPSSRPEIKRFTPAQENRQDEKEDKPKHQRITSMGDTCHICGNKVYLLERHIEQSKLYHRSCFRHSDLSPTSKVYARPSALVGKDDGQHKAGAVSGMAQLGKGFAAPKSLDRSTLPVDGGNVKSSLKFEGSDRNGDTSSRINSHIGQTSHLSKTANDTSHSDKKLNGHSYMAQNGPVSCRDRNKLISVPEKSNEEINKQSDWRSKQSDLSKSEHKSSSADSASAGSQSESQNARLKDAWPPASKDSTENVDKRAPKGETTPIPKPRQSVLKDNDTTVGKNYSDRTRIKEEKMEVDETVRRTKIAENKSSESRLNKNESSAKKSEPRNLPLVFQMVEEKEKSTDLLSKSEVRKGKMDIAETKDPKPKPRRFLKKNEKKNPVSTEKLSKNEKLNGSTERLNKTETKTHKSTERLNKSEKKLHDSAEKLHKPDKHEKTVSGCDEKFTKTKKSTEKTAGEKLRDARSRLEDSSQDGVKTRKKSAPRECPRTPPCPSVSSSSSEASTPPPLPRTTPPALRGGPMPTSPPSSPKRVTQSVSPTPSPRGASGPPKPLRSKFLDQPTESAMVKIMHDSRKAEPMEVDDLMATASKWSPGEEPVAVMVCPSQQKTDQSEQAVRGGLLKSLANVRRQTETTTNHEQIVETKAGIVSPPQSKNESDFSFNKKDKETCAGESNMRSIHIEIKSPEDTRSAKLSDLSHLSNENQASKPSEVIVDTTPIPAWQKDLAKRNAEKEAKVKARPKSSEFILNTEKDTIPPRRKLQNGDENKLSGNIKVDTTPTPSWKKEATTRKMDSGKLTRPKSVQLLHNDERNITLANQVNNNTPQSSALDCKFNKQNGKVNSSESNNNPGVPEWQMEAQKRQQARKGNYVDPEKVKPHVNDVKKNDNDKYNYSSKDSEGKLGIHENGVGRTLIGTKVEEKTEPSPICRPGLIKITPGRTFNFDDTCSLDSSTELSPTKNKGRKPPPRPTSPPSINKTQKYQKSSIPSRPAPPRFDKSPGKMSPQEIQRQLMDIDTKLTDLELKGRRLEDSIRNAQEDEEDDLMMDWFMLVSQKNELVRQEVDLIYAARENELENEQDCVQDQLRQLLDKPNKTKADKQEEKFLLGKLLEIVDQRSTIVDSIDDDKHRYEEEDKQIADVLTKKGLTKSQENLC